MAVAINTHKYKKLIDVDWEFIKSGEGRLLWGLITWPKGKWKKNIHQYDYCIRCGEKEITRAHGYYEIDKP